MRVHSKYKINLHTHTFFSDGYCSPLAMAQEANRLGFTSLCITDHFNQDPEYVQWFGSYAHEMAIREASKIIPIILGMEVYVGGAEVLCFGGELIKKIRAHKGTISIEQFEEWRKECYCAVILCHPGQFYNDHIPIIDGYELYNGGRDWFKGREPVGLEHLPYWSNSDAHIDSGLGSGYNVVDTKITNESDLIKYIKRGKQPDAVAQGVFV